MPTKKVDPIASCIPINDPILVFKRNARVQRIEVTEEMLSRTNSVAPLVVIIVLQRSNYSDLMNSFRFGTSSSNAVDPEAAGGQPIELSFGAKKAPHTFLASSVLSRLALPKTQPNSSLSLSLFSLSHSNSHNYPTPSPAFASAPSTLSHARHTNTSHVRQARRGYQARRCRCQA